MNADRLALLRAIGKDDHVANREQIAELVKAVDEAYKKLELKLAELEAANKKIKKLEKSLAHFLRKQES